MTEENRATPDHGDRLVGALWGTALGDALGLPAEGMSPRAIERRFGRVDRFRLLGSIGFVSDDTEQSALVAQSLLRAPDDVERFVAAFRRSLLGWFVRLPFGIGLATIRACLRAAIGLRRTGVRSAGNGAAMRAAVIGTFFRDRPAERAAFGRALAEVTHMDPRAVEGALFVAELASACAKGTAAAPRLPLFEEAFALVREPALAAALSEARALAARSAPIAEAGATLGTSGFVLHTVPFAAFVFLRESGAPLGALAAAISAGGDTDSIAAILGAWLGALHGASGLPRELVARIQDGPFGPTHLRALGEALASTRPGASVAIPRYSVLGALLRNLALYPVVLAHGARRLLPF
jgi:ADP-ribosylglycohydrolase